MLRIIKAERLKLHHTVAGALIWLAPAIMIISCFILNPPYFYSMSLNWWYTIFIFIVMALTCSLVHQKEEKKLQYRNIYQSPVSLAKVWRGKVYIIVVDTIVSANILGMLVSFLSFWQHGSVENGLAVTMLAVNIVWVLNIWIVPIFLFVAKKAGFYIPFFLGAVASVLGVLYATSHNWWLNPASWASRIMCTVVRYMPNGLPIDKEHSYLIVAWPTTVCVILVSLALFFSFTFLTAVFFKRGHKGC